MHHPGYALIFASASAHAFATAVFGVVLPESVAQPPFSMNWLCCHAPLLRNSVSFAAASDCAMKFSTQMGVRMAVTAASERCRAMLSAVLPSVHPHHEKPTIIMPTAPRTIPQNAGFNHCGTRMRNSFVSGEKIVSPRCREHNTSIEGIGKYLRCVGKEVWTYQWIPMKTG
jgi:hypothetical protein